MRSTSASNNTSPGATPAPHTGGQSRPKPATTSAPGRGSRQIACGDWKASEVGEVVHEPEVDSAAIEIDNADFTVGKTYFTTTKGDILAATSTDVGAEYFFLGNSTVVSKDSSVGVAVSKNTIYVSSAL